VEGGEPGCACDDPPPYWLDATGGGRSALVFASPHSGRHYPGALLAATRLALRDLRRCEDPHVDTLVAPAARAVGAAWLRATHARAWLDVNRAADELDPAMLALPRAGPWRASRRAELGLGVIPRDAGPAGRIYRHRLSHAEVEARIQRLHAPWHRRLEALLAAARSRHGLALLVDWHSMPPQPGPAVPDVVLGDLHGRSAHPGLVALAEQVLAGQGLRVARNMPYAGAWTLERHGAPDAGIHAIQIEIDRRLYLDADLLDPGPGLAALAARLSRAMAALSAGLAVLAPALVPGPDRWAAE
jgi:N-formylglutamate amidohydrolase